MSFENEDPDRLQGLGHMYLEQALAQQGRRGPEDPAAGTLMLAGVILESQAQVLDRLERVLLLLDERLPTRPSLERAVDRG